MTPCQNQNGEPGMTVRTPATDDNDNDTDMKVEPKGQIQIQMWTPSASD